MKKYIAIGILLLIFVVLALIPSQDNFNLTGAVIGISPVAEDTLIVPTEPITNSTEKNENEVQDNVVEFTDNETDSFSTESFSIMSTTLNSSQSQNVSEWRTEGRVLTNNRYYTGHIASNISKTNLTEYTMPANIQSGLAVAKNSLFFGSGSGNTLYQMNLSNLSQQIDNFTVADSVSNTPAITDDHIYFGGGSVIYQVNASNISQHISNYTVGGTVLAPVVANGSIFFNGGDTLYHNNASNVSQNFNNYTDTKNLNGQPTVSGEFVYITVSSTNFNARQLNRSNISQLLFSEYSDGRFIDTPLTIAGDYGYFCSSRHLFQVNASDISQRTGIFSHNPSSSYGCDITPVVANKKVYIASDNPTKFWQLNESDISQNFASYSIGNTNPVNWIVATNDTVLVGGSTSLYQFDVEDVSKRVMSYSLGTSVRGPMVVDGRVLFSKYTNVLYEYYSAVPIVTLISPNASHTISGTAENVSFNCSANSVVGMKNISLYLTNNNNVSFTENQTKIASDSSVTANWTLQLGAGNYTWNCLAYAADENYQWGINRTIVTDTSAPEFTDFENQTSEYGESFSYDIEATDISGIGCFTVNDTTNYKIDCDGVLQNNTNLSINEYWLNITVNDTVGFETSGIMWVNVTDTIPPAVNVTYPANGANSSNTALQINYTVFDLNTISCWYSNETMDVNITLASCVNITTVSWAEGQHNLTIYVNDSYANENNSNVSFSIDLSPPTFTYIKNQSILSVNALSHDINATDATAVSCFTVNDTTNFQIDCEGVLQNNTVLSAGIYGLNITVNDTFDFNHSALMSVEINTTPAIGLSVDSPTGNINATQNLTFNVQATVSCSNTDCGEINVSLDPAVVSEATCGSDCNLCNEDLVTDSCDSGNIADCGTNGADGHFFTNDIWVSGTFSPGGAINITAELDSNYGGSYYVTGWQDGVKMNEFGCYDGTDNYCSGYTSLDFADNKCNISFGSGYTGSEAANFGNDTTINSSASLDTPYHIRVTYSYIVDCSTAGAGDGRSESDGDFCEEGSHGENDGINITLTQSTKSGLVSTNSSATPFWTSVTNPYNVSLNEGESETITWIVNASGDMNTTHEFFVYANKTSDMSISNASTKWNVTIVNFTVGIAAPSVSISYPVDGSYYSDSVDALNYSVTNATVLGSCWHTNNSGVLNSTSVTAGVNFTNVVSIENSNTWTVYCNDTANNTGSGSTTFTVDTINPTVSIAYPSNDTLSADTGLHVNYTATDTNLDSCWYTNDSMSVNTTLASCANITSVTWDLGKHNVTVYANDSVGREGQATVNFTIFAVYPQLNFSSPTPNNLASQTSTTFEVNVSIVESDINEIKYNWNGTNNTLYNDSLVLMYNFDNISSLGDNDSYVIDHSKYGNNGTFSGAEFNLSGKYGKAAHFDSNDYINASNAGSLDLGGMFTLSAWFKIDSHDAGYSFLITKDSASGGSYDLGFKGSKPYVAINDGSWAEYVTDAAISTGEWHHLLGLRNSSDHVEIYVDGILNKTFASTKTPQKVTTDVFIGRRVSTDYEYIGLIDEVRIWNISLSSDEVYQEYVSNLNKFNSTQWYLFVNQSLNASHGLPDGGYTYYASAKDVDGNENSTETRTVNIDATFPSINILTPTNDTNTNNNDLEVNFTAIDANLDACWYNSNGGSNSTLVGCANITTITWIDGSHTITIFANDTFGNVNSSSVTFTIDATASTINFVAPTPNDAISQTSTTVKVNVSLVEESVDEIKYNWNGTNFTMYNNSLVLMMNFNNVSGLGENSTFVVDVSKYGNNGTMGNGDEYINMDGGKYYGAVDLDGTNDYVSLDAINLGNQFTISAWVKPDDQTNILTVIASSDSGASTDGFKIFINTWNTKDKKLIFETGNGASSNNAETPINAISLGEWNHIVVNVNRSAGIANLFVNGINVTSDNSIRNDFENNQAIRIGIMTDDAWDYYGLIDEVRIWNISLSADEVYQQYVSNLNKINSTQWYLYVNQSLNASHGLVEGDYTYYATAKDVDGNENSTETRTITIDATIPRITILTPANNTNSTDNGLDINYTAVDINLDSCWYSNDTMSVNTTLTNCANITTIIWSESQHNLTIYVNDSAGNENKSEITFSIDSVDPNVSIITPENSSFNNNNALHVNYTAVDTNLDSCWYSNDTMSVNTTLANCVNITSLTWIEGQHNVTVYANDSYGNTGNDAVSFTVDTISPTITIITPINNTNTTNTRLNINYTAVDTNLDSCWYSNDTMSINTTLANCANITTIIWSEGQHNLTIYANDSANNENKSELVFTILPDRDNDGLADSNDPLLFNETFVNTTGIDYLNVTIGGNKTNETYSGRQEIIFYDNNTLMINFSHNFTESNLDLSNITIIKGNNSIVVNFSGQLQGNKSLYISDNSFGGLCVKDAEVSNISEVSSECDGENETDFTACLGGDLTTDGILCTDLGSVIKVENLQYSAILGTITEESSSSSSPSGGGSSSGSTSGGAGTTTPVECFKDSQCQQDYVCYQQKCVKLFDVKIIEVDSPIGKDGFLDFTYFLKGMANINSDVIVDFWLERGGERISSGKDTIYLGEFEEKTESTQIYIPKDLETGEYQFHVQVSFENYQAVSFRTVYVEQKEEEIEVILIEEPEIQKPFDLFLFTALLLFLIMIILLTVLHWKREVWIKKIKIIKVIQFNHLWKKVKQLIKEIKLYLIKKINVPTTAESIVVKPKKESKRVVRKSKVKKKKVIKKKVVKKLDKESYQRKFNSGMLKAVLSKPKKPAAKNKLINPLKEEELYKRKFIGGLTAAILRKKTKKK